MKCSQCGVPECHHHKDKTCLVCGSNSWNTKLGQWTVSKEIRPHVEGFRVAILKQEPIMGADAGMYEVSLQVGKWQLMGLRSYRPNP